MYFKITRLFAALPSLLAVLKIEESIQILYELYVILVQQYFPDFPLGPQPCGICFCGRSAHFVKDKFSRRGRMELICPPDVLPLCGPVSF